MKSKSKSGILCIGGPLNRRKVTYYGDTFEFTYLLNNKTFPVTNLPSEYQLRNNIKVKNHIYHIKEFKRGDFVSKCYVYESIDNDINLLGTLFGNVEV